MGKKAVGIWLFFFALKTGIGAEPPVKVTLKGKAFVTKPLVRLKDIATLSIPKTHRFLDLPELVIAPSPLPGRRRVITAGQVATKLAGAGLREDEFVLSGEKWVVVMRKGKPLTARELEAALRKALGKPVRLLLPPPPLVLPEGTLIVKAPLPEKDRATLPVLLFIDGHPVSHIRVLVALSPRPKPSAPFLVKRRQLVRLLVRVGRVIVTAKGRALRDGRLGDEIPVAVSWNQKPIKGIVTGAGEVTIPVW